MNPIEKFARRLRNVEKLATKAATQPALAYSSIEDGAIQSIENGSLKAVIGKQWDGTQATTIVNGPVPPTPSLPWAYGAALTATVRWDGLFADGAIPPMDFARVEVHISDDLYFTAETADTLVSTIETPRGGEVVAARDPGTWYTKLVTRTLSGARSVGTETMEIVVTDPADAVPTEPPDTSPTLFAQGTLSAIILHTLDIDQSTVLEYHASVTDGFEPDETTLLAETRSQVFTVTQLLDEPALALDTTYYFRVVAKNVVGAADPSPQVSAQLDPSKVSEVVIQQLIAGFVLAGSIQVGNITINPDTGITIPLATGGQIRFPSDGSDAVVDAVIRARSLVANKARILGTENTLEGSISLRSGVLAPTEPPDVSLTWTNSPGSYDLVTPTDVGPPGNYEVSGLWDAGDAWLVYRQGSSSNPQVSKVDKATGAVTYLFTAFITFTVGGEVTPRLGGVVMIGTDYYVLTRDDGRAKGWYVRKFNSSHVQTDEWLRSAAYPNPITLGTDGTYLYTAHRQNGTNKIAVARYNPDGTGGITLFVSDNAVSYDVTGLYVGAADFGVTRVVVTTAGPIYAYNLAGNRALTHEWPAAPSGGGKGIAWDGTRFHTLSSSGSIWHFSKIVTATTADFTYSWRDSSATGGTHETQPGPAKTYTVPPRSWVRVEAPPTPGGGGTDDPDSVRIYVNNHRQPDLGTGVTTGIYDAFDLGGAAGQTTNGFDSVTTGSRGIIRSAASDSNGPLTLFAGDAQYRLAGINLDDASGTIPLSVGAGSITYQVKNGWMFIRVNVTGAGATTAAAVNLTIDGAVPAAYRTSSVLYNPAFYGAQVGYVSLTASGRISARGSTGTLTNVAGTISYPLGS